MRSQDLLQHVRDTVASIHFAWAVLHPGILQTAHQLTIDSNPATRGIRAPFDTPVIDLISGTKIPPSEMRQRLIESATPILLVAIQAIAEEAISQVTRADKIKRQIERAVEQRSIDRSRASELHHWRYVRNVLGHGNGTISKETVSEHAKDENQGIVLFKELTLWGPHVPLSKAVADPRAITTSPVLIAAGQRVTVGLGDLLAAGLVWSDFMRDAYKL